MVVNEAQLNAFLGKAVGDLGAAISAVLILLNDESKYCARGTSLS